MIYIDHPLALMIWIAVAGPTTHSESFVAMVSDSGTYFINTYQS
jgi:hypothetical protein